MKIQIAVPLQDACTSDWYPLKGDSSDALPEGLPHLFHQPSYEALSVLVRKRIKKEARSRKTKVGYKVSVEVMHYDPTSPVECYGVYLVATITFK